MADNWRVDDWSDIITSYLMKVLSLTPSEALQVGFLCEADCDKLIELAGPLLPLGTVIAKYPSITSVVVWPPASTSAPARRD